MQQKSFWKRCASCDGNGDVEHYFPLEASDDPYYADYPSYRTCQNCGGSGSIHVEIAK